MSSTDQTQNAVSLLLEQHDQLRRLFDDVQEASEEDRDRAFDALVRMLTAHETAENHLIYPALEAISNDGGRTAVQHDHEVDQADRDVKELTRMGPASPDFAVAFKSFRSAVEAHADREEAEVFPQLVRALDEARLQELAQALRTYAPDNPSAHSDSDHRRSAASGSMA